MERKEKASKILGIYNILSNAKYGKMEDSDKIKLWKIGRVLKPIATKLDEDMRDAAEKMKQGFDDFDDKYAKWQKTQAMLADKSNKSDDLPMTVLEANDFSLTIQSYNKLVGDAIKEFGDKEVSVDIECIDENAFLKLISSNEWNVNDTVEIGSFILA